MSNQYVTSNLLKEEPDLIDLIDRFISRLPAMQEAIENAAEEKNWDIFKNLVHQMKGVAGNYGYPMLTNLCSEIELNVKSGNFLEINKQINAFNNIAKTILAGSEENHKIAKS